MEDFIELTIGLLIVIFTIIWGIILASVIFGSLGFIGVKFYELL